MNMIIKVDTAVTVPVNLMPLIDETDFKTRETGIVYNESGMDLVWNFVTPDGVQTQTAVTPTTGGDYDWVHKGDAMYNIEIPASGGASINNDTEGAGWFTGICDGVLAWRSPIFSFVPANVSDSLILGTDNLQVDTTEIEGTDATNQIRDSIVDDATRIDATALNTLSGHDPGSQIASQTDVTGLNDLSSADVETACDSAITSNTDINNIDTGVNNIEAKLPSKNYLSGSSDADGGIDTTEAAVIQSECTDALNTYDPPTKGELDTVESNIRGADSDDLKTISDQIDGITGDATEANQTTIINHLTGIKGGGWSNETLVAIDVLLDSIKAKTDDMNFTGDDIKATLDSEQVTVATNNDKDDYTLSAAGVDEVIDEVIEGTVTLRQAMRLFLSVLTGKSSGGGTTTLTFRDIGDTKNRLVVTVDANGNRTIVGSRDGS